MLVVCLFPLLWRIYFLGPRSVESPCKSGSLGWTLCGPNGLSVSFADDDAAQHGETEEEEK